MKLLRRALGPLVLAALAASAIAAGPPSAVGTWTGTLTREGQDLDVTVRIADSPQGLTARLSARDFRAVDIPLRNVSVEDGRLRFDLTGDATTLRFDGALDGASVAGTLDENGRPGTFRLSRTSASGERACDERPAAFSNGEVALRGTLLRPRGAAKPAAVLITHGSGPASRDQGRFLAAALCEAGVAALIYDKRGVGDSTGDWAASFSDLADDAVAGVAWLAAQPDLDPRRIGTYGHSQGASISPMVANRSPHVAFVMAGAGAGTPGWEVEIFSVWNSVRGQVRDAADGAEARAYVERLVQTARTGQGVEAFIADAPRFSDRPWFIEPPPADDGYWRIGRTSFDYNPADEWRRVRQPALLIWGERDERIPVAPAVVAIGAAARAAGNGDVRIEVLPGARHAFDLQAEGDAWPRVAPGYPEMLVRYAADFRPEP